MKLRNRLTLTFSLLTAFVLLAAFVIAIVLDERAELRQLDIELLSEATLVGEQLFDQRDGEGQKVVAVARFAALYERDGRLRSVTVGFTDVPPLARLDLPSPLPRDGVYIDLRNATEPLRAIVFPTRQGRVLLLAISRRNIDADVRSLYEVFGALFLLGLAAAGLVAFVLGRRMAADVERVAATARRVATGDLAARVPRQGAASDELRDLAGDLDHMIAQLDAVMSAQRTFVSHAAHELRSPLAALRGELQLALRHPRDVDGYRAAVESALGDVHELMALAEDLLTMARATEARTDDARAPLATVVSDALRIAGGAARAREVRFAATDPPPVEVRGRAQDLSRALRNLLDNAVSHTATGGEVRLRVETDGERVRLLVEDDGPGVAPEEREQIFAPFYRGAREQESSGAGLGLAIARQLARHHGGEVALVDSPRGAHFVLELARA